MNPEVHERACRLIDVSHVEGISAAERAWLDEHLEECAACRARMRANERALQALRSNIVGVDPELVSITQTRVRLRARELRENQVRMRALWISCAFSWVLGVASAPLVWRAFQWVGLHARLPNLIWETAFVLWWLLPAGAVAVLLAWQRRHVATQDSYTTLPRWAAANLAGANRGTTTGRTGQEPGESENESMTEEKQPVKEQVRMIRWRMTHENSRFADEFRIIPRWLKGLAIALFIVGQVVAQVVHFYNPNMGPLAAYMAAAAGTALVVDLLLLLFGYVNRDAKRRGMNSTLWTLLAIFVPYLIGLIIYFLMREPLPYNCPGCGAMVNARFNFCPACKRNLRPTCPQCKREVRLEDRYCPYCAQELATTKSPLPEQKTGQEMVTPAG